MLEKIKDGIFKARSYWNKPPKGYDVCYKEFVSFSLGFGGISFISVLVQWTAIATGIHMMISYFKVTTGLVWVFGIAAAVIALFRSAILSMIIDNSNSKKGKFKPFLMWASICSCVCFCLIPFIPESWNNISAFSFNLPAIPIMGMSKPSNINFSVAILVAFAMLQIGTFFHTLLNQAMAGIEQTISTVAQERANIGAIKGLICNIPSSLVNIVLPILAGALFATSGGWNSISMYRWVFPFCAVGGIICILFMVKGTKERVVVNKKYVAKVKFLQGAKELSKNKYFWLIAIYNIGYAIRVLANITTWITQYSFESEAAKTIVGLYCTTFLMTVLVLGMVFGPALIKKFGKKNVLLVSNIGFAVMLLAQFLSYRNPIIILVTVFAQNLFMGVGYIATIMVADVLDYQQWKTGKRLEGFWQNYYAVIATIVGVFTTMLAPLFLSFAGVGFSDDVPTALRDPEMRNQMFKFQTLLGLIGAAIAIVPMFFYDLTEKKHANYVRALKIRAAVDNYGDGELLDTDVLNLKEICDYSQEAQDAFVLDELSKHTETEAILANYDEVFVRVEAERVRQEAADFARNLELEEKKFAARLDKVAKKAKKKNIPFDEKDFTNKFIEKSRFIKNKTEAASSDGKDQQEEIK